MSCRFCSASPANPGTRVIARILGARAMGLHRSRKCCLHSHAHFVKGGFCWKVMLECWPRACTSPDGGCNHQQHCEEETCHARVPCSKCRGICAAECIKVMQRLGSQFANYNQLTVSQNRDCTFDMQVVSIFHLAQASGDLGP